MKAPVRAAAAVAAMIAVSLVAACSSGAEESEPEAIRIGVTADRVPGTFSVAVPNIIAIDNVAVYDYLFRVNDYLELVPRLATGYELSEDRTVITVSLREGVVFSDGTEFNASTYIEYVEGLVALGDEWSDSITWNQFEPEISLIGDYTVEYRLNQPTLANRLLYGGPDFPSFLSILSMPITSPAALVDIEASAIDPIESGPYLLESVTPDVSVELTKNETYWDADSYPFEKVTLQVYADEVAALNALKAGEVDAASLSAPYLPAAEESGLDAFESQGTWTGLYIGDSTGTVVPALGDKRVRQAIALAFDRETINETLVGGYGKVTSQPFDPRSPDYTDGSDERYGYDPDKARELLADAGYENGFDLTIPTTPFLGIDRWEPIVQQSLGDIGIRVTFDQYADTNAYFTAVLAPNYPVLLYTVNPFDTVAIFVIDDAILNSFKSDHPRIDELWFEVLGSGGIEESNEAQRELGEYVVDEALIAVFAYEPSFWVAAPGYEVHAQNQYAMIDEFTRAE
jgi:peptide/nickel transport system substrate-binding protein